MLEKQLLCAHSTLHTCSNHINYANAAKLSLLLNCAGGAEIRREITSTASSLRLARQFFTRQTCVSSLMLMKMTLKGFTRTGASAQKRARAFTKAHSRTKQDGRQERVCCLQETHACPSVFDSRTMSAYHCPAVVASLIIL